LDLDNIIKNAEGYLEYQRSYGELLYLEPIESITASMESKEETMQPDKPKSTMRTMDNTMAIRPEIEIGIDETWDASTSMPELDSKINKCMQCPLGSTRRKFVFGTGNPNADIMVIGEAPGADEDLQGKPFVGRAGQLLTKILEAIGLSREEVFIANILKCRPPDNRQPLPSEVAECEPYLKKQIELINPAFILVLGLTAADTLLRTKNKMADARGSLHNYHGKKLLLTYHPAALLRNPNLKKLVWEDVKQLRSLYDEFLENK
jgi:DNA polymerase